MHVVIERKTDDEQSEQSQPRLQIFGVQDFHVDTENRTVTLFWPYHSAIAGWETTIEGELCAATEESILELDTYVDYLEHAYEVNHTVVVLSAAFDRLTQALEYVPNEYRDEITVIHQDDDVDTVASSFHQDSWNLK